GMTVNCARCHDHKFDPIPQGDYYRLKAVFDGIDHGDHPILTPGEQTEHERALAPVRARVRELRALLEEIDKRQPADAMLEPASGAALAKGRFGSALDGRRGSGACKAKPSFYQPTFTAECWARAHSRAGFNIFLACNP